jgi:hypothetical protein
MVDMREIVHQLVKGPEAAVRVLFMVLEETVALLGLL